jgi:Transcriptional regulators containing a DNA-binding HTH domain and an aminotransferase domain (MocR family) and their eukaryotic orthologs
MLLIDKGAKETLCEQIYTQLREQIIRGSISETGMLPSTRNLAKSLGVSRNTVESAYQQLSAEGYITSKARSGYKIEKIETSLLKNQDSAGAADIAQISQELNEQGWINTDRISFQYGRLSFADFPIRIFRRIMNQILLSEDMDLISSYNNRKGEPGFRTEILKYIYESRGVRCGLEQIIISTGITTTIGLLCQMFMSHTREIAVEDPCYDTVRHVFINHGFRVIPIPVGKDGIDLEKLNGSGAGAVYVTPSHQFPTGAVMPVNRRLALIEWAERNNAFIIEDDYDSELRYNSRPIPSMQSLDSKGRVIYLNTFSKSFAPAFRLSFMILPEILLSDYQRHFGRYNCPAPLLEQKIMHTFMKEGQWARHLRKICVANKKRHDFLVSSVMEIMGNRVVIHGKNAGLHILLEVKNGLTETELIEKAGSAGITVYPVSCYYADHSSCSDHQVLIGFGSLTEDEIVTGIRLLNEAWFLSL